MSDGYVVEVIPPAGSAVYRWHLRRRHLAGALALVMTLIGGLAALYLQHRQVVFADLRLRTERAEEQRKLDAMERQTQALQRQNLESERSIERIERVLGPTHRDAAKKASPARASLRRNDDSDAALAARLKSLAGASERTHAQTNRLTRMVGRILVLRRLAFIARAQMIAAIPSLNPVDGGVNAGFGWRTDPFPEFHKGLDLAADYGTRVHAAAAGIVASAGWAGDYGIKVDIDHGNGYHTWYCHLSRTAVSPGQRVARGEPIGAVGSTGESTGPHLHYQVMHAGVAIDPLPFLHGVPPGIMATLPQNSGVQ
jgi:murein DD-endopeptidase MepM/ murein hydrolase activator NlpD